MVVSLLSLLLVATRPGNEGGRKQHNQHSNPESGRQMAENKHFVRRQNYSRYSDITSNQPSIIRYVIMVLSLSDA